MNDHEREERAIWKLEQGGYRVQRHAGRYIVIGPKRLDELENLAALVALAEAIYDRVWTGRKITPSA